MDSISFGAFPLMMGVVAAIQLGWHIGVLVLLYLILQELRQLRTR